jgi:MFS family permease
VFGLAQSVVLLDVSRFVQGIGGACSWAGAMAWLVRRAPVERRGALLGTAMAAAIFGALLGPAVGAAAESVGTGPVFGAAGVLAGALALWALRFDPPPPAAITGDERARLLLAARDRPVIAAMLFVTAPGVLFGTIGVLGPLRLDELGASAAAVGAVFLAAAALEAITSPIVGSLSDRFGRLAPMRVGLLAAVPVLLLLPVPGSALLVAVLVVAAAPAIGTCWAPSMALLADGTDARGIDPALGFSLMNAAWGLGHVAGGAGGGALGELAGDAVAYTLLAAGCLALAWWAQPARVAAPAAVTA